MISPEEQKEVWSDIYSCDIEKVPSPKTNLDRFAFYNQIKSKLLDILKDTLHLDIEVENTDEHDMIKVKADERTLDAEA